MFNQITKASQAIADTLSFSGDTLASTLVDSVIIAAFAVALIAPLAQNNQVVEEKFEPRTFLTSPHSPSVQAVAVNKSTYLQ